MKRNENRFSLCILFLLVFVILAVRLLHPSWFEQNCLAILSWDVFGYYFYIPAWFIHHDVGIKDFGWVKQILDTYHPTIGFYQAYAGPAGDWVMKYPMGMSILYFPFFAIGHVAAHIFHYPANGFTLPYQVSVALGGVVYTVIGLWFLRKILLRYFTGKVVALTMAILVLGTNFLELTAIDGAMPHNYLFTLFSLIVWLTIRWHEDPRWKFAVPLGLLCGLVVLVRPTSGVIALVPLTWGLWNGPSLREKFSLILKNYLQVISMAVIMFGMVFLQMIYWKIHAGSFFYFSYGKDDSLKWIAPYLKEVLFSYRKGWLLYTPVMFFALAGFVPLFRRYRSLFPTVFLFFLVNLVVVSSWPAWWYAGSFSQRALMESYLLLAFPLAALCACILPVKGFPRWAILAAVSILVALNLFQTWQYVHNIIDPSRMTKAYYWRVFGKTYATTQDHLYLMPTDRVEEHDTMPASVSYAGKLLAGYDFEHPDQKNLALYCRDTANTGHYSMRLNKANEFSPGINIPYNQLSKHDFAWIRACGYLYFTCKPEELQCALVITCSQQGEAYKYRMTPLDRENLKPYIWNRVCMDYMIPSLDHRSEPVKAYFWYHGDRQVLVDDIEVRLFEGERD